MSFESNEDRLQTLEEKVAGLVKVVEAQEAFINNHGRLLIALAKGKNNLERLVLAIAPNLDERQRKSLMDPFSAQKSLLEIIEKRYKDATKGSDEGLSPGPPSNPLPDLF